MRTTLPLAISCLAACAAPPKQADDAFAIQEAVAAGYEAMETSRSWRAGDSAVFRIELEDGAETLVRFVRLQVQPLSGGASPTVAGETLTLPANIGESMNLTITYTNGAGVKESERFRSAVLYYSVEVYDGDGRFQDASTSKVPEAFLTKGFSKVCEVSLANRHLFEDGGNGGLDPEVRREYVQGLFALVSMLQIVQENSALSPILWQVVDRPSLMSVILEGSVNLSIEGLDTLPRRAVHAFPEPVGELPGFDVPLTITLNGKPALHLELGVCESLPPLLISGGIVSIEGVHATRPERRVRMEMVASRRGSGLGFLRDFN